MKNFESGLRKYKDAYSTYYYTPTRDNLNNLVNYLKELSESISKLDLRDAETNKAIKQFELNEKEMIKHNQIALERGEVKLTPDGISGQIETNLIKISSKALENIRQKLRDANTKSDAYISNTPQENKGFRRVTPATSEPASENKGFRRVTPATSEPSTKAQLVKSLGSNNKGGRVR